MRKQTKSNYDSCRKIIMGAAILLLMVMGCDNSTSPNQALKTSNNIPITMQSGDAIKSVMDELPIYTADGFYFLPPMVKDSNYSGTFDTGLSPVVEICETPACDELHAIFDMDGEGSERVRVDEEDEHYIVNWHTDRTGTEVGQTYRIRVRVEGTVLAHADIQMAGNGRDAKNITDDEAIALVDGRTLPIKFRIEEGIVYVIDSNGGTITSEDGLVTLEIPENAVDETIEISISPATDELDDEDVVPGALFDFGPSPFTFNEPVILTIMFDSSNLPDGVSEEELRLLAVVDGEWVQLPGSSVDLSNSSVTGPIDSFSRKGVGRGKVNEIAVTPVDASIAVDETVQFEAIVTNVDGEEMNRNIRWSSSDEDIATIDSDGIATALTHGDAIIEARAGNVTATANLSVEGSGPVVTTITVSPSEVTIDEGATTQFTATVYDQSDEVMEDETVSWSSGDDGIASVDEAGLATGISEGETVIIASIGEVSGSASLTVEAQGPVVDRIEVSPLTATINTGATQQFVAIVYDQDDEVMEDETVTWSSDDSFVASVDLDGLATGLSEGETTIIASIGGVMSVANLIVVDAFVTRWNTTLSSGTTIVLGLEGEVNATIYWGDGNQTEVTIPGFYDHTYETEGIYDVSVTGTVTAYRSGGNNNTREKLIEVVAWGDVGFTSLNSAFLNAFNLVSVPSSSAGIENVTDMESMFVNARSFNGDIGSWDTRNVTNMRRMFLGAWSFNQDIGNWETGNVTDMEEMFTFARSFNQDIGRWDTRNVTNMSRMFNGSFSTGMAFNQDIGNWDTGNVTDMSTMFSEAWYFNQDIGSWDTRNVTNMRAMFWRAESFNRDISDWKTGNVTNMSSMFLSAISFNQDIGSWDTGNVRTMQNMFSGATNFNGEIGSWNTENVTTMEGMFRDATSFNRDINSWNTSNVTSMERMFNNASSFNQNIGGWDTGNVTTMSLMFFEATVFNQDIGAWDTGNVRSMSWMFSDAKAFNQDIGSWNTTSLSSMRDIFRDATSFNQDIGGWDTRIVSNMRGVFHGATSFNQNIGSWDTGNVTTMRDMFNGATAFDYDISGWDTGRVRDMQTMFRDATSFNRDLSGWCVSLITSKPSGFDTGAISWMLPRPVWGTCPE